VANDPRILINTPEAPRASRVTAPSLEAAWLWIGRFALLLTLVALGDWLLAWIPTRFGSTEWEFGTIVATFSGMPLLTMGLAGVYGAAIARGIRWQIIATSWVLLVLAMLLFGALLVFALDIPVALRAVEGPARLGILKAIAKTGMIGILFGGAFVFAAIGGLRHAKRSRA
jgi:hypothetical protein